MKNIRAKKYEKVYKLLKSNNIEDVYIGLHILKTRFNEKDWLWNFPNDEVEERDFSSNITSGRYIMDISKKVVLIVNAVYIFTCNRKGVYEKDYTKL